MGTQVTVEYKQNSDGSVEPLKVRTVVISTQHAAPGTAKRTEECAGYTGKEMVAPPMDEMNKQIVEHVVKKCMGEIILKNGEPALTLFGDHTHLHINPSGKFIIGGPQGDAGLTGRKIIIDTCGGWGAHGGGAFSGKDPSKVDRSAAYYCRWIAKSLVAAGLCHRALLQVSYAIGVPEPLSVFVDSYGSVKPGMSDADLLEVIKANFDMRAGMLVIELDMMKPKYKKTACYGHFGNASRPSDPDFTWEVPKTLKIDVPTN